LDAELIIIHVKYAVFRAVIRTDVSGSNIVSIIKVTRIGGLETTLAVTSSRSTLRRNTSILRLLVTANVFPSSQSLAALMIDVIPASIILVPRKATRRHIPEDDILHSLRRENLKSYIALTGWTL
jgi:hypothetical protein